MKMLNFCEPFGTERTSQKLQSSLLLYMYLHKSLIPEMEIPNASSYKILSGISDFTVTKQHWKSQAEESGLWGLYSNFP